MHLACLNATRAAIAMLVVLLLPTLVSVNLHAQTLVAIPPNNDPAIAIAADYSPSDQPPAIEAFSQPNAGPTNAIAESGSSVSIPGTASSSPILSNPCVHSARYQCSSCRNHNATHLPHFASIKRYKQAHYWGYPEYFCEAPLGAAMSTVFHAHKVLGDAEQTILFRCDFFPESSPHAMQLNYFGKRRLEKLTSRSMQMGVPLRIERTTFNPDLDDLRRQFVLEHSSASNLGWTPDQVVLVGEAAGVSGLEAIIQYQNQLTQATSGPSSGSSNSAPTMDVPAATNNSANPR